MFMEDKTKKKQCSTAYTKQIGTMQIIIMEGTIDSKRSTGTTQVKNTIQIMHEEQLQWDGGWTKKWMMSDYQSIFGLLTEGGATAFIEVQ